MFFSIWKYTRQKTPAHLSTPFHSIRSVRPPAFSDFLFYVGANGDSTSKYRLHNGTCDGRRLGVQQEHGVAINFVFRWKWVHVFDGCTCWATSIMLHGC